MKDKFTSTQWFISFVTIFTIVLWCFSHQLEFMFGDMGVVAILPMVVFFGLGILNKEDFNNFLWTIIILAAGGLALGKAVNSSGLLRTIAESITTRVEVPMKDKFTSTQWFISFVTIFTIVLWCFSHQLEFMFGDMGVVAILPMVVFFGLGILNKEDFNNFLWTIIILAAGGLALGKAVNSSGLLRTIAESITTRVEVP